jgi:hypothetical protein
MGMAIIVVGSTAAGLVFGWVGRSFCIATALADEQSEQIMAEELAAAWVRADEATRQCVVPSAFQPITIEAEYRHVDHA